MPWGRQLRRVFDRPPRRRAVRGGLRQEDPVLRRLRGTTFEDRAGVGRITSDEIRNPAYRRECYEAPRVLDRATVYRDVGGRRLFLSVFRGHRAGFFAPDDLRALGAAA